MSHSTILTMKGKKKKDSSTHDYHINLYIIFIYLILSSGWNIEYSYIGSLTCISTYLLIMILIFYYFCLNSFFKFLLKYFLKNCFSVLTRQFWFHLKMSLFCSLVKDNTENICLLTLSHY